MPDALDDRTYTIRLFDIYGRLLTLRQQRLMRLYYLDDLSLGEIAERLRITRQAVHDSLHTSVEELSRIETHLGLVARPRRDGGNRSAPEHRTRVRILVRRLRRLADEIEHEGLREIARRLEAIQADL